MTVNLTGPGFKVGDRVVHVHNTRGSIGTVCNVGLIQVYWSHRGATTLLDAGMLEPAERWMTDAERDGV